MTHGASPWIIPLSAAAGFLIVWFVMPGRKVTDSTETDTVTTEDHSEQAPPVDIPFDHGSTGPEIKDRRS